MACGRASCATISVPMITCAEAPNDALDSRSRPRGWAVLLRALAAARARHAQRHALLALDDRLLADIGITREEARTEAAKPCWRR